MQADLNLKMLIFSVQAPHYQRGLSQPCPVLDSSDGISLIPSINAQRHLRQFVLRRFLGEVCRWDAKKYRRPCTARTEKDEGTTVLYSLLTRTSADAHG